MAQGGLRAVGRLTIPVRRPSPDEVRALVAHAFPHWADEPLRPVRDEGTAHALFRLGAHKVVRIPLLAEAAAHVARQEAILTTFAGLPLAVPRVLATAPGAASPFPWSVLGWIEGETLARAGCGDWDAAARELGRFVAAMRACDSRAGAPSGPDSARRGAPLAAVDGWMHEAIRSIADLYDPDALAAAWEVALAAPRWPGPPMWVHGDLHGANLLVRDGRLVAVIDFGLASLGDPACDLAPAWTVLPRAARAAFRATAGLDDEAWARGRGWGLYAGTVALAHYRNANPTLAAIGRRAVEAVLE